MTYQVNLVPKAMAYGLARGSAFHLIVEMEAAGMAKEQINAVLRGEIEGPRGKNEPIEEKAIANAWALADALRDHPSSQELELILEGCEQEFMIQIPGSPHYMAGRIDQMCHRRGACWVSELKSANPRAQYERFLDDWKNKKQADFLMLGARSLGYDPAGVYVRQVVEGNPPRVWEHEETRSDHALQLAQLNIHQTCEIITMLKATFGVNCPWPHICSQWPCSVPGKCEYESLEGRRVETFTDDDLSMFKQREEHLEIAKKFLALEQETL